MAVKLDTSEVIPGLWVSEHDDGLIFFQPDANRIFVCDHIGARIWTGLSKGLSLDEISDEIAAGFGVSPERVQHDAQVFATALKKRGWVAERPVTTRWTRARLTIQSWFELALHDWRISRGGFGLIHRTLKKKRTAKQRGLPPPVADLCDALETAVCFYFKRVHCLQRAAVIVRMLRKNGIAADLVIACRPSPFFSHAWAEVDGKVVNDLPAYKEQLLVLYRQRSRPRREEE
jgi:hypothetical protein